MNLFQDSTVERRAFWAVIDACPFYGSKIWLTKYKNMMHDTFHGNKIKDTPPCAIRLLMGSQQVFSSITSRSVWCLSVLWKQDMADKIQEHDEWCVPWEQDKRYFALCHWWVRSRYFHQSHPGQFFSTLR